MKKQNLILLTVGGLLNVACVVVPPSNNAPGHYYPPQQMTAPQQPIVMQAPAPRPIIIQQQAPAPRPIIVQQQAPQPPQVIRRYVYSQTPEQPRYCPLPNLGITPNQPHNLGTTPTHNPPQAPCTIKVATGDSQPHPDTETSRAGSPVDLARAGPDDNPHNREENKPNPKALC